MTGILGDLYENPQAVARMQHASDAKSAIFDHIGAGAFAATLNEEQRDTLLAATLGTTRAQLADIASVVFERVNENVRRDRIRERTWKIQNSVIERIGPELETELQRMKGTRPKTKKTYAKDQQHFRDFCSGIGVPAMPASPEAIAAYVLDGGMNPPVLRRRLAAIAEWHRLGGYIMPAKDPLVRVALKHVLDKAEAERKDDGKAKA